MTQTLVRMAREHPGLKQRLFDLAGRVGYDTRHWCRAVMYEQTFADVERLGPAGLDVLEISGADTWRTAFDFRSYRSPAYPEFDVCTDVLEERFDLIIADQVFEHLRHPAAALRNIRTMLKPGGRLLVLTPFLIRVHPCPLDVHRWTEEGLRFLLVDNGFAAEGIRTGAWGNRRAVRANLRRFPRVGFGKDLRNEPGCPLVVWAWAQGEGTAAPAV